MISPVGLIDFGGVRVTPGQTEFRDWPYYATRIITSSLQFDNLQLSCKKWHSLSYYYAIKDGIPLVRTCQPYLKLYQKHCITKITKMQASIKGYFSKNGYNVKAVKSSTSAAVSSPAPVKLVSYRTPNSPSRPLKRKAAEDLVTENKNDYELKRCRRYQPHWKRVFPWLQYDAVNDMMWCGVCREFHSSLKIKGTATNKFVEGTNLFKICSVKDHESSKVHRDCIDINAAKLNPSDTPLTKANRKIHDHLLNIS